jgi:hypothetical protein
LGVLLAEGSLQVNVQAVGNGEEVNEAVGQFIANILCGVDFAYF